MNLVQAGGRVAAKVAGAGLATTFGAVARLRPTDKPLHPRGRQLSAVLERHGCARRWEVPWLDEAGSDQVLVRFSRAVGLPDALPDVLGLTLRVHATSWSADLLLASTGDGRATRFTLLPRREPAGGYGSLMPYRTPTGPLMFLARHDGDRITLCAAPPTGDWLPFGGIELPTEQDPVDPTLSFDPLLNTVPGLGVYPWTRQLREGAYAAARSARRAKAPLGAAVRR